MQPFFHRSDRLRAVAPYSTSDGHYEGGGLSQHLWAVHNVAMGLGAVEIFFILVVVALIVYVLWRLLIRPRR